MPSNAMQCLERNWQVRMLTTWDITGLLLIHDYPVYPADMYNVTMRL